LAAGINIVDFLSETTTLCTSKGEARRSIQGNAIAVNKSKVDESKSVNTSDLLNGKYILLQNGKKKYHVVVVS
jgi:tyrosyl-tRNA synthetase